MDFTNPLVYGVLNLRRPIGENKVNSVLTVSRIFLEHNRRFANQSDS